MGMTRGMTHHSSRSRLCPSWSLSIRLKGSPRPGGDYRLQRRSQATEVGDVSVASGREFLHHLVLTDPSRLGDLFRTPAFEDLRGPRKRTACQTCFVLVGLGRPIVHRNNIFRSPTTPHRDDGDQGRMTVTSTEVQVHRTRRGGRTHLLTFLDDTLCRDLE